MSVLKTPSLHDGTQRVRSLTCCYQAANASAPAVAATVPTAAPATLVFNGTVLGLPDGSVDASRLPPQLNGLRGFSAPALPNTTYYALAAGTGLGSLQPQLSYVQVLLVLHIRQGAMLA